MRPTHSSLHSLFPEAGPITVRCEADYYGATRLVSRHLGLSEPAFSTSSWVHGRDLLPVPRDNFVPLSRTPRQTHLVGNRTDEKWWHDNGYTRAVATGNPFIYTEPSGLAKQPGSVLAMPHHTQGGTLRDTPHTERWLRAVAKLREEFPIVAVCLHAEDVASLSPFVESLGLEWITGAQVKTDALPRMRAIFDWFEYVITDSLGSHLPYAAFCGCKVGFYDELHVYKWEHFKPHYSARVRPELERNMVYYQEDSVRGRFPFLFPPSVAEAVAPKEWADQILGVDSRRSFEEMARLLGWRWDEGEPAFADWAYAEAASRFGAVSDEMPLSLKLKEQDEKMAAIKAEAKAVAAENKKLRRRLEDRGWMDHSFAGWVAKRIHSLEKRIRR